MRSSKSLSLALVGIPVSWNERRQVQRRREAEDASSSRANSPQLLDRALVLDSKRSELVRVFRTSLVLEEEQSKVRACSKQKMESREVESTFADSAAFATSKAWLSFNPASSDECFSAIVYKIQGSHQYDEDEESLKEGKEKDSRPTEPWSRRELPRPLPSPTPA